MLHQRPQLSVVGDASNGFEAIAHAHTLRPDVILMDIAMPHMDGVEATARIRTELPNIRVLGLSMLARNEGPADAIERAGAAGFFVKGTDTQRLIDHLMAFHASRGAGDRASSVRRVRSADSPARPARRRSSRHRAGARSRARTRVRRGWRHRRRPRGRRRRSAASAGRDSWWT